MSDITRVTAVVRSHSISEYDNWKKNVRLKSKSDLIKCDKKSDIGKCFVFSSSIVATIWKCKNKISQTETEGSSY